jgi:lipid A 3-O-deacylase
LLNSFVDVQLGTHNTKVSVGGSFMTGYFNSPYKNSSTKNKKVSYYLYAQPQVSIVGYDATLQGGLFNRNSPYTIASKNINRITFQGDYGIVFTFAKMYVEYCQSILTKEFCTGTYHRWGGIRIGVRF